MFIMKSGKIKSVEGIELQNQECIRKLGNKETYKCLGILEGDTIKQEEKIRKVPKKNEGAPIKLALQ